MKRILLGIILIFVPLTSAIYSKTAESAPDDFLGSFSGNVAIMSDYSPRGVTLSDKNPAVHGAMNYTLDSGPYLGIGMTSINISDGDGASTETTLSGGLKKQFSDFNIDVSGIGYIYTGADSNLHYNFFETKISVGKDFGFANITASINYSPNYFADSGAGWYPALNLAGPVIKDLNFIGSIAHQAVNDNAHLHLPDYWHWSAGVVYNFQGFGLVAQYIDTSMSNAVCGGGCEPRVVFGVIRVF